LESTFTVFTDANALTYLKTATLGGPSDVETVREKVIGKCPMVVVDGCSIKCLDDTGDRRIHHHRSILQESPAATGTCDGVHHRMYLLTAANGTG